MKKILILFITIFSLNNLFAGTWMPTGTLASNCAIFGMTGTLSGDVIISDYNTQLQKKQSGSNTWIPAGLAGRKVRFLTTLPNGEIYAISGSGAYIASSTTVIHRSTDNGATWQDVFSRSFPYNNIVTGGMTILSDGSLIAGLSVQRGPTIGDIIWTFIYKSTNGGNSWFPKDSMQSGETHGLLTAQNDKILLGTTEDGVYYSMSGGNHWWPVDTMPHFFGTRYTMDIVKSRDGTIFYTEGAKIRRSTDNCSTTQVLVTPSPSFAINAICISTDNELFIATDDKKLYKSTTMGDTWELMRTGLPDAANVYSLKIIDGKLYAGTYAYGVYYYQPDAVNIGNGNSLAKDFQLSQNYPNPFNPTTKISYSIAKSLFVNISVYDILGKKVSEIVNGVKASGNYEITFDASSLSDGIYFYKMQAGEFSEIKKMSLIK